MTDAATRGGISPLPTVPSIAAIGMALVLSGVTGGAAQAQDAEDELGNWLVYNGTVRCSDRWSLLWGRIKR